MRAAVTPFVRATGFLTLLTALAMLPPPTRGADAPGPHGGTRGTRLRLARPASRPGRSQAANHLLVQLDPRVETRFTAAGAQSRGLRLSHAVRGTSWTRMAIPRGANPQAALAAARRLPGVLRATRDPIVRVEATLPRDPIFKDDDDPSLEPCDPLENPNCNPMDLADQWGLFKVGAPAAWDTQRGSPNVVIAILDTGVDLDHDDLKGNIWTNPRDPQDGRDNDGNGLVDDVHGADFCGDNVGDPALDDPESRDGNPDIPAGGEWSFDLDDEFLFGFRFDGDPAVGDGMDNDGDGTIDGGVFHGTFVAGIAAAMTDNRNSESGQYEGMAGTAWNCKLMAVRMINAEGWGLGSDAAQAIAYAADMGAQVINCSWGLPVDTDDPETLAEIQVVAEAVRYAAGKGAVVVCAGGNGGVAGTTPTGLHFPGLMRETIAVGASDWRDRRSEFSSSALPGEVPDNGRDDDGNGWVDDVLDVVAPGELIWSTYVLSAYDALLFELLGQSLEPGAPSYLVADGTSFSTPLVSGYAALLLSQNPGMSAAQVRQALRASALDLRDPNGGGQSLPGYDIYSGFGRVRMLFSGGGGTPPPPANQPPVLSVTGQPGYLTDGVNPDMGQRTTAFEFRVRYRDAEGQRPTFVRLRLNASQGRPVGSGVFPMTPIVTRPPGTPAAGILYRATVRNLAVGAYAYTFEASDGTTITRFPASSAFAGPTVTPPRPRR